MNTIVNSEVKDTGWINAGPGAYVRSIVATGQTKPMPAKTSPDKEDTMNTEYTLEKSQRDFLARDVEKSYYRHIEDLQKKYLLEDIPSSAEELLKRIADGKFKLVENKNRSRYDSPWSHITWRTEDIDHGAYDKGVKTVDGERRHVMQDVMILPLEKAMKSTRDFQKITLH